MREEMLPIGGKEKGVNVYADTCKRPTASFSVNCNREEQAFIVGMDELMAKLSKKTQDEGFKIDSTKLTTQDAVDFITLFRMGNVKWADAPMTDEEKEEYQKFKLYVKNRVFKKELIDTKYAFQKKVAVKFDMLIDVITDWYWWLLKDEAKELINSRRYSLIGQ